MPNVAALSGTLGLETSPFVAGVNRAIASTLQMDRGMRTMATSMRLSSGAADLLGGSVGGMTGRIAMSVGHIGSLLRDVRHLGNTFKSLLAATGIGAGILAVSFAVSKLSDAFNASKVASENFKKSMEAIRKSISETQTAIDASDLNVRATGAKMIGGSAMEAIQHESSINAIIKRRNELVTKEFETRERLLQIDRELRTLNPGSRLAWLTGDLRRMKELNIEAASLNRELRLLSGAQVGTGKEQAALEAAFQFRRISDRVKRQNAEHKEQVEKREAKLRIDSDILNFSTRNLALSADRKLVMDSVEDFRKSSSLSGFAKLQNLGTGFAKHSPTSETIGESGSIGFREIERGMPSSATFGSQRFNSFQHTEETLDESKKIQHEQLQELKKLNAALTLN